MSHLRRRLAHLIRVPPTLGFRAQRPFLPQPIMTPSKFPPARNLFLSRLAWLAGMERRITIAAARMAKFMTCTL